MTSLICLVGRCNLADGRLVKENEPFETGKDEAAILIRGGIAKENVPVTSPKPLEEMNPESVPTKVVDETIVPSPEQPQGDPPEQKVDKRRRKA